MSYSFASDAVSVLSSRELFDLLRGERLCEGRAVIRHLSEYGIGTAQREPVYALDQSESKKVIRLCQKNDDAIRAAASRLVPTD